MSSNPVFQVLRFIDLIAQDFTTGVDGHEIIFIFVSQYGKQLEESWFPNFRAWMKVSFSNYSQIQ